MILCVIYGKFKSILHTHNFNYVNGRVNHKYEAKCQPFNNHCFYITQQYVCVIYFNDRVSDDLWFVKLTQ